MYAPDENFTGAIHLFERLCSLASTYGSSEQVHYSSCFDSPFETFGSKEPYFSLERRLHLSFLPPLPRFLGPWTDSALGCHQRSPHRVKSAQGKQQIKLLSVLEESPVTDLAIAELAFDGPARVFDHRS